MTFEKIAIVIVFLVTLILLQLVIKYRGKAIKMSFPKTNNIDVRARLSLSKTERADLISIGSQSFLVIFSKAGAPAIIELDGVNEFNAEVSSQ
jgi:hypothetical protein